MKMRIGHSRDIHQLKEGYPLILGGVNIKHTKGLKGHSDGDALVHVIIEAIIGALGKGDIGKFFPDTDPKLKGISSLIMLNKMRDLLNQEGYEIVNIDTLIMAENPHLASFLPLMKKRIATCLLIDEDKINIKATRGEKLGFVGQEEGIEADCVLLLQEKES